MKTGWLVLMGICLAGLTRLWTPLKDESIDESHGRHDQITVMGRSALIYKPRVTKTDVDVLLPAIFVLHGSGCIAADMFDKDFEALADLHGFLVVYPQMKVIRADEWGYGDDIPYFAALAKRLREKDFNLDARRIFVCGHSAGGTMALFLQNEVDFFCGAGAVEGAVGHLHAWDMAKKGSPTMVVWNHADPVLEEYAPDGGEPAYYELTVKTLRRHGSKNFSVKPLPISKVIQSAELRHFPEDTAPKLVMLGFKSEPGTHKWAHTRWCSFSATAELVKFFLELPCNR